MLEIMRTRLLMAGCLAIALAPLTNAVAEHCALVVVHSHHTVLDLNGEPITSPVTDEPVRTPGADTAVAGCALHDTDDPVNTALIVPGSNSVTVRYGVTPPTSGTFTFAGQTTSLTFVETRTVEGATTYDSLPIFFDPALSITGGTAVATVCVDQGCASATYRTVS